MRKAYSVIQADTRERATPWIAAAGLPSYQPSSSRYSPYVRLPGRWTQVLSESIYKERSQGICALSARSDFGHNFVWFSERLDAGSVSVEKVEDITLYPSNAAGRRPANGKDLVVDRVVAALDGKELCVQVLNFPIPDRT